jgi:hypothetical protein
MAFHGTYEGNLRQRIERSHDPGKPNLAAFGSEAASGQREDVSYPFRNRVF